MAFPLGVPTRMQPNPLPTIPITALVLGFRPENGIHFQGYAGSAWRGAFGWALKRTVCVVRDIPCAQCLLQRTCVWPYVFETPPPPDTEKMRRYPNAPHPFALVIDPQPHDGLYYLGLNLFGKAHAHLPYFIHAFALAGQAGLGQRREVYSLAEVWQFADGLDWQLIHRPGENLIPHRQFHLPIPKTPSRLRIDLLTPLRIRRNEVFVDAASFRFADWFGSLLRRISMLSYFHTDTPLETDFAALTLAAGGVGIHAAKLHWDDWARYSSRQEKKIQMGGLLGSFELDGADLGPFWPYLWLGQWTHAAKGAVMGLGRYQIEAASLPGSV